MARAEAYSNISLNETVIKFELDDKRGGGGNNELIIISDIINPIQTKNNDNEYNNDRFQIINEILPNSDFSKIPNIHLIYNGENGEAKYYYGNINSLINLSISEIAPLNKNFDNISERLKNLLNGFNSNSYINMLTLVNYCDHKDESDYIYEEDNEIYSIFYEYKKKFKNIYSQLLFLRGFNYSYISFTRFCKGFARKFVYVIPIDLSIDNYKYNEPYENVKNKIGSYITSYSYKAFPYIFKYLEENMDKTKAKKLKDLEDKIKSLESLKDTYFPKLIDDKINEYLSKYEESDLKSEKKEEEWKYPFTKILQDFRFDGSEIDKSKIIYQIPYPSILKDDILLIYQKIIYEVCKKKFLKLGFKKEKLIEIANKVYEDIQNHAKQLIETENYKIFFMNKHFYYIKQCYRLWIGYKYKYKHEFNNKWDIEKLLYLVHDCKLGDFYSGDHERFKYTILSEEEKNIKKKEIKDIILKKDDEPKNIKSKELENKLHENPGIMAEALKEIGMKDFDEYLDKIDEEKQKKNEDKENSNKNMMAEVSEGVGTKVDKIDEEKQKKNEDKEDKENPNKNINSYEKLRMIYEDFIIGSKSINELEELVYSLSNLTELRENADKKCHEFDENNKRLQDAIEDNEMIKKIKDDELLKKLENLMLKFQQKCHDCNKINDGIRNLDKFALNYFEEIMENIEENYHLIIGAELEGGLCFNLEEFIHSLYDSCGSRHGFSSVDLYKTSFRLPLLYSYKNAVTYFYNEKANDYFRHFSGNDFFDSPLGGLRYYTISSEGKSIISNTIKNLLDGVKKNIPSGWKITSKAGFFRIEPQGEKLKEIELPIGKSSIFMEGIYKNINESLALNSKDGKENIQDKGKVTQDNLKEIYEDAFNMIMNKIVENKLIEKKEKTDSINQELINFVKKIENETEGFANIKSKKISNILSDLNNNQKLTRVKGSELNQLLTSNIAKCQEEILNLIQEEIKLGQNKVKPQFILLLDASSKMEDFVENFVRNIIYKVLLKLNFEDSDKIQIYTFNSEDTSNMSYSVKKLKKFSFDCEGDIIFAEAFKNSLNEMSKINNSRYYLLTVLSGNIKDKDEIRSIAFKSIGLSAKIFIKSRVVRVNLNNQNIDNDEITDGLLQQISSGDLKVYKPIEIGSNSSNEEIIQKIVDYFN